MIPKLKICHRRKIEGRINKVCFRMNVQKFDVNLREPRISKKKKKGCVVPSNSPAPAHRSKSYY
jgi:hypothetical protein